MVSVVRMDEDFMVSVGRTLLMPDLSLTSERSTDPGIVSEPFLADDGEPLGYLSWTPKRPGQSLREKFPLSGARTEERHTKAGRVC